MLLACPYLFWLAFENGRSKLDHKRAGALAHLLLAKLLELSMRYPAVQHAIHRLLICVSSKTVGGAIWFHNSCLRRERDQIFRSPTRAAGVLAEPRKMDLTADIVSADEAGRGSPFPQLE